MINEEYQAICTEVDLPGQAVAETNFVHVMSISQFIQLTLRKQNQIRIAHNTQETAVR